MLAAAIGPLGAWHAHTGKCFKNGSLIPPSQMLVVFYNDSQAICGENIKRKPRRTGNVPTKTILLGHQEEQKALENPMI